MPRRRLKNWELRVTLAEDQGSAELDAVRAAQHTQHRPRELRRAATTRPVYMVQLLHDQDPDVLSQALGDAGAHSITWCADGDL